MAKLWERLRIGITGVIAVSLVANLIFWIVSPTAFYDVWTALSPKRHINYYEIFLNRLVCAHVMYGAYIWFFGNPETWKRMATAPQQWRTHPLYLFAVLSLPFVAPVHIVEYLIKAPWAHALVTEDGPLEDTTTWTALSAAVLFLFTASRKPGRERTLALCMAALVFFLFGMEEISWGQRIFHITSPKIIQEYNYQDETNLHNFINPALNAVSLIFFAAIAAMLYYYQPVQRFLRDRLGLDFGIDATDSLYFLIFLLVLPGMATHGSEMGEEYFGLFGLIFALRQAAGVVRSRRVSA